VLEDALPIASHFAATLNDLRSWLDEISAELRSIDVPPQAAASSEQIRKLLDSAKVCQNREHSTLSLTSGMAPGRAIHHPNLACQKIFFLSEKFSSQL